MIIRNATVLNQWFLFEKLDIRIEGGRITELGQNLQGDESFDAAGLRVLPGPVDIHIHGCAGADFNDGTEEALQTMADHLASRGVTSFLPTSLTVSAQRLLDNYTMLRRYRETLHTGARVLGINMEGPFFNKEKKGAQAEEHLKLPDMQLFLKLYEASGGSIRLVDLAPELPGALEFIEQAKHYCTVSTAHTVATYEQALEAVRHGVSHTTHLYNAMPSFLHRAPGVIGAVFDSHVTAELICDGIHVHPSAIRTTFRVLGADRVCLISDALAASGMPDGEYDLGGQTVYVREGKATLADGTIAGSSTNVFSCMQNAVRFGVRLEDAVKAATLTPARAVGLDSEVGSIEVGKAADLVFVNDNFELKLVMIEGSFFER